MGEIDSQKLSFVFIMYGTIVGIARRNYNTEQDNQNNQAFV